MTYTATFVSTVRIEAENIAEARRLAKELRIIGQRTGRRRAGRHDRDTIAYEVAVETATVTLAKRP